MVLLDNLAGADVAAKTSLKGKPKGEAGREGRGHGTTAARR